MPFYKLKLQIAKLAQAQVWVVAGCPVDAPWVCEQQQAVAAHVLYGFGIAGYVQQFQIQLIWVVFYPAQVLIRQLLHPNFYVIFGVQAVF